MRFSTTSGTRAWNGLTVSRIAHCRQLEGFARGLACCSPAAAATTHRAGHRWLLTMGWDWRTLTLPIRTNRGVAARLAQTATPTPAYTRWPEKDR